MWRSPEKFLWRPFFFVFFISLRVSAPLALNMCEMWFNGIKIAFFLKNYKNSPNSWGPRSQTPIYDTFEQRWSPRGRPWPRGQILKSLASKVKSLALDSRPPVLENWPVLGSRTAVFFELLKFCGAVEKFVGKRFFEEIAWKIFVKTFFSFLEIAWKIFVKTFFFFFFESTCACVLGLGLEHSCTWPREVLSSERLSLASDFFCVLGLEPCVLDSTSAFELQWLSQNVSKVTYLPFSTILV